MNPIHSSTGGVVRAKRPSYIRELDGLRGIAVLIVLMAHLPQLGSSSVAFGLRRIPELLHLGYLGVDLFFVLSGFLITRILLLGKESGGSMWDFIMRRALRTFPIYYLTIGVLAVFEPSRTLIWAALHGSNIIFALDRAEHPLRHTWSLSVEEHFYLFWPFLVYAMSRENGRRLAGLLMPAIAILCALIAVTLFRPGLANALIYRITPCRMFSISLGAWLAYREIELRAPGRWRESFLQLGLGLGCMVLFHAAYPSRNAPLIELKPVLQHFGIGILCLWTVEQTIRRQGHSQPIFRLLRSGWLNEVGKVSYGLYLYHYVIFYYLGIMPGKMISGGGFLTLALALALTVTVTLLSFHLVEKPFLKLKDRF